jgi:hypothetical protein
LKGTAFRPFASTSFVMAALAARGTIVEERRFSAAIASSNQRGL